MPILNWMGKDAVVNHDKDVPFRLLKKNKSKSIGDSENLIIEGDNLEALKALLPHYQNKIKCIYIDPPYNTGNEKWVYNDNVDSPKIKKWLGDVVGIDDLTRHDKWLCMMYPRLKLLQRFLKSDGIITVSIDDNELNNLGILLDDLFGPENRLACAPWLAEPSGGKEKTGLRNGHEYIYIYHNGVSENISKETRSTGELNRKDKWGKYRKGRELMKWGGTSLKKDRPGQWYSLLTPDGTEVWPIKNNGEEGHWRWGKLQKMKQIIQDPEYAHWEKTSFDDGITWKGLHERWIPYEKIRDVKRSVGWTTWLDSHGFNADATRELKEIFGKKPFDTPKPMSLIKWIISLHSDDDALVLDSFAGSGTTGAAVLSLNKEDGGNRKFILVEMEENVARSVTSKRIKMEIKKYDYKEGFQYAVLDKKLFNADGRINPECTFEELASYLYFTETKTILDTKKISKTLLDTHNETQIHLMFDGVGKNNLDRKFLTALDKNKDKIIYADKCTLDDSTLEKYKTVFKQIPYEVKEF